MRAATFLLLIAISVPIIIATDVRSDNQPRECSMRGSKTLVASARARVFQRDTAIYGCMYRTDRRILLGHEVDAPDPLFLSHIRLAGRYVGYSRAIASRAGNKVEVLSVDLRDDRVQHHWTGGSDAYANGQPDESFVTDLELKRSGAVAWILPTQVREPGFPPQVGPQKHAVMKADATGTGVLDEAEDVFLRSLALSRSYLFWLHGSGPRVASLE